ncbi:hypothetical protein AAHE18_19G061300 [Arachis hypogaea]
MNWNHRSPFNYPKKLIELLTCWIDFKLLQDKLQLRHNKSKHKLLPAYSIKDSLPRRQYGICRGVTSMPGTNNRTQFKTNDLVNTFQLALSSVAMDAPKCG